MRIKGTLIALLAAWGLMAAPGYAGTVSNVTVNNYSDVSLGVTWVITSSATLGYVAEASTASDFSGTLYSFSTSNNDDTSLSIPGLSANTTYFVQVGAVSVGSTNYAALNPPDVMTLASNAVNRQFLAITSTTLTVSWDALLPANASGYLLNVSTDSQFLGTLYSSGTASVAASTLTVSGLQPSTVYYARVGTINAAMIPNFSPVAGSTQTNIATSPSGLQGVAQSVSSIQWSWNVVPGATGYTLYYATSPTIVATNIGGNSYTENLLSANTSYDRVVTFWTGGIESVASSSATRFTWANVPAVGASPVTNVSSTAFTANWMGSSNPPNTVYKVNLALNNAFTVGITTPVPFSANLTANTTDFSNLVPSTMYYYRVTAINGDGIQTNPGPISSTMTLSGGSTSSGGGLASVAPSSIQEGVQIQMATMTFFVPNGGYSSGGGIKVDLPAGFGPYLQTTNSNSNGYVTAISSPARTLDVTPSTSTAGVVVTLAGGQSLTAGSTIQVFIANLYTACPPPGQTTAHWTLSSLSGAGGAFVPITTQPSQSIIAGAAKYIWFVPWDPMTVVTGQASSALTVSGRSNCGNPAAMGQTVVMQLSGYLQDYQTADTNALFASDAGYATQITSVTLSTGSTQASFFYKTTTIGNNLSLRASFNDIQYGYPTYISRPVNVLSAPITFNGVSLDSGTAAAGTSAFALTPDNDGQSDFVFIRFNPSNSTIQWRVRISSDGFTSWVYERWGTGNPGGTLQWDGRNNFGSGGANSFVPNGTYTVRLEYPGLTPNDSLTVSVLTANISGKVRLGSTPMANVWVNANAVSSSGYGGAMTDVNGDYTIYGLRSGQSYNLMANFYDPSSQSAVTGSLSAVSAPASGADITVSQPALIRVAATLTQAGSNTLYGQVRAHTANYSQDYWGSLRLLSGTTTSDNGDYYNPSTWTVLAVQPGAYTVRLALQSFPPVQQSITVSAGQVADLPVFNMTRPPNVYGRITLPSAVVNATWIPVEGIRSGQTNPSAWGGVYFNAGQSTGIYQIFNVAAGNYNFRVRAPGYVPVLVSTTVGTADIGDMNNGGLDVASGSFGIGGRINGTITVQGDTSALSSLNLWINAYSPLLASGEFTQVSLSTHAVTTNSSYQIAGLADGTYQVYPPYLQGFELNPPGPKTVTVSGGVGSLNLTLVKNTGQITGTITLPGSNSDYGQVSLSINGPMMSTTTVASGASYTLPNLGSGFYDLNAFYATSGAQVRRQIAVVNTQSSTANLNLSAPTFVVTGSVTIQAAFTLETTSGTPITINTMADMLANDTTQYFYINGSQLVLPTSRVEAFPKRFDSYGGSTRDGFGNNFFAADFRYGSIQSDGSYSISGLSPGVWEINVYPYLDGGYKPSLASVRQTLTVSTASFGGINFALSAGNSVSGTISLPGGATDNRNFEALIVTDRGDHVQSSFLYLGSAGTPASSLTYQFKNLPNGRYSLIVTDPGTWDPNLMQFVKKYAAKPAAFEINGANITNLNINLTRASRILGQLSILGKNQDGTPASNLITQNNLSLLPSSLRVSAQANPWVEGGYQMANMSGGGTGGHHLAIDGNNQFSIDGLVPGNYDVQFRQDYAGADGTGQGSVNLAAYVLGQVKVTEGQFTDIGTVELKQGLSLSGTVKDSLGNNLPNIRVRAKPSGRDDYYSTSETYTDASGQFTVTGLNPDLKSYDIVAAPRPDVGQLTPPSAYGQKVKKAVDVTQTPLPAVNFTLDAANASLSGQVLTANGGPLGYPDGDKQQGFPAAAIYMQLDGVPSASNDPLGDIREATGLDGSFSVTSLVPGVYNVQVISLNYKPQKFTVTVAAGSNSAGTITLQTGAVLNTTVAKPDGSGVNTSDVRFAVAVTANLGTIIFGQIASDDNTRTIRSIRFSGFDSTKIYSVLLFDQSDNITSPIEGKNLTFASDSEEKTLSLTYQPSAPTAYVQVKKSGSDADVSFYFSRTLRNVQPTDSTQAGLLTVLSGAGTLSSFVMGGDRKTMSVLYTPAAGEQTATIRFSGYTAEVDPRTGSEFVLTKTVVLRFGQRATAEQNINPVLGGEVSLAESDGDPSGVNVPANSLRGDDGSAAAADSNFNISFTATEDEADLVSSAPGYRSPARGARVANLGTQMARGQAAYVPEAYEAIKSARASANVNPFSSFYSVLLPAGLSHTLNESATLTLQYDSTADPNLINVYFFDGNKYLLENINRTVDTVNRTISVEVSHFSTFVVLEDNSQVIIADGASGSGASIEVFNFPNPFDLTSKTKTLSDKGLNASMTTDGTIIRYFVPASKGGTASLDIFNVAGEKVRSISLGAPSVDTYHYVTWDGKNDSGNKVASGVYVGLLKVGGNTKTWKMAVIK